jgi:LPS export ABC transporter protein LptC
MTTDRSSHLQKKKVRVIFFTIFFLINFSLPTFCEEIEQSISDFSLSGFGKKGRKTWEIQGSCADIFAQDIRLTDIVARHYGEEKITLVSDKGNFDKKNNQVHLQDNVVITTDSGARLTTDYLDWDRQNSLVITQAEVKIKRENIIAHALGAKGSTDLKEIQLQKDVHVQIKPEGASANKQDSASNRVDIFCDGPLNIDYAKRIATFNNNVKVREGSTRLYSDQLFIYFGNSSRRNNRLHKGMFAAAGGNIEKIVARGNVRIVRDDNISFSDEAVYKADEKKFVLRGRPHLVIYSEGDFLNASSGD